MLDKDTIDNPLFDEATDLLIVGRYKKHVVIAAPHHAIGGVKYLRCKDHRESDENVGLIVKEIAEKLGISSIIACNAIIDQNKDLSTDYSLQIIKWAPKYLIEIHGHGGKKDRKNLIEISSGSLNRNSLSILFSDTLQRKMLQKDNLKQFSVNGDFKSIHFRATNSATITTDNWLAIHIELPPTLRLNEINLLPACCADFIDMLSETIFEICAPRPHGYMQL